MSESPSLSELAKTVWDVVVIGAGPAGSVAATCIAASGLQVLLVEAKAFPRNKVCGGCLNRRAWQALEQVTLAASQETAATRIRQAGASTVNRIRLNCLGRQAEWKLPSMHSISRRTMDDVLVEIARESGAIFCSETSAKVVNDEAEPFRNVIVTRSNHDSATLRARTVIAADGLSHPSLTDFEEFSSEISAGSRLGLGTLVTDHSDAFPTHELTMSVGRDGYVGLVRVEDNLLNVAAAFDAHVLKQSSAASAVTSVLESCNLPMLESLRTAKWTGTLQLTRQSRTIATRRLFLAGDAAGYVEPFTGEGMSWAIVSALQLCRLLTAHSLDDCERLSVSWVSQWRKQVRRKQLLCRILAGLLRRPKLARYSLATAQSIPWVPQWLITQASGTSHYK